MVELNMPGFPRRKINTLFLATVIVPTLLATLYFGLIASDVYISESRFVVRTPEKPAGSALGVFLKNTGFSTNSDESYTAQSAMISRDALVALNKGGAFRAAYSHPGISIFERFDPLGFSGSFEDLYRTFKGHVSLEHENTDTITVLKVRAYGKDDARLINERLLEIAEGAVNRLNARGRNDLIHFASNEVDDAKRHARESAVALAAFRQRTQIVDPDKQAAIQLQIIAKLQDEVISTRSEIRGLSEVAPRNPQIGVLRAKLDELREEIRAESSGVAGGNGSLASASVEYQRLQLDNQVAEKQLAGALTSLQEAQNEALRKQAYLERIAQPNLPDAPLEPRRVRGILSVLVLGLVAYGILSMLLAGLREHYD
jgi:capsular polysaccharide transport system permease protein